ncbi:MAG: PorP/SprF family type IX secretion system membrane protein [Flavobacteriales bacterium]|nr:PorP/SprF family type IX secretion system membrane protein [Flavobacteriales bacterium]
MSLRVPYIALLIVLTAGWGNGLCGQDIHFGQFDQALWNYNPAAAADFSASWRVGMHYRKQWGSINKGYGTRALVAEKSFFRKRSNTNYLGVALNVAQDKRNLGSVSHFDGSGAVAWHLATDRYNRLSMGLRIGYVQRSIDFTGLAWDAQYDGVTYNAAADNREQVASQSESIFDAAFGFQWWHSHDVQWKIGYARHHLGGRFDYLAGSQNQLSARHTLHGWLQQKTSILLFDYHLMVQRQSGAMEITAGMIGSYRIGNDSRYTGIYASSSVQAGCYYRYGDAIIPTVGFEWQRNFALYLSYDITLSAWKKAVGIAGGPEFVLRYSGSNTKPVAKLSGS